MSRMYWQNARRRITSEYNSLLTRTDPSFRLVAYLSREDVMKSLLQWVVSGLDELDQEASEAQMSSFDHAVSSPQLNPSYRASPVPGSGPNSPPLTPANLGEESLDETRTEGIRLSDGMDRQQSGDELRAR